MLLGSSGGAFGPGSIEVDWVVLICSVVFLLFHGKAWLQLTAIGGVIAQTSHPVAVYVWAVRVEWKDRWRQTAADDGCSRKRVKDTQELLEE